MAVHKKFRVGVVRFPGSNCDLDTFKFFKKFGHKPIFVWYTDTTLPSIDVLVLPGGFAFGDRSYKKATGEYTIDPGKLALASPVMKAVGSFVRKGLPILGICNGFQILVKAGMLPGKLLQNDSRKFFCDYTTCEIGGASFFDDKTLLGRKLSIPVAHGYGKYVVTKKELVGLQKNGQIFLRYSGLNPNGSLANIAGVSNKAHTIFGMMPHPERSPDASLFMRALENYAERQKISKRERSNLFSNS